MFPTNRLFATADPPCLTMPVAAREGRDHSEDAGNLAGLRSQAREQNRVRRARNSWRRVWLSFQPVKVPPSRVPCNGPQKLDQHHQDRRDTGPACLDPWLVRTVRVMLVLLLAL